MAAKPDLGAVIRAWVADQLQTRGWSQRQLAQRAGIAAASLNDLMNDPDRTPRPTTVAKLEAVLGPAPGGGGGGSAFGLAILSPDELPQTLGGKGFVDMARAARDVPERWTVARYTAPGGLLPFPGNAGAFVLIDRLDALDSGDLVAVRSPLGDGLRYLVDPYLIGPAGDDTGHEIRGAAGVNILGKVAAIVILP